MKSCPTCRCQYEDALSFCKRDGSALVSIERTGYCKKCESRYPLGLERCPLHGQVLALDGPETATGLNYCLICSNDYPKEFKLCPLHGVVLQNVPQDPRDTTEIPGSEISAARIATPAGEEKSEASFVTSESRYQDSAAQAVEVERRDYSTSETVAANGREIPPTERTVVMDMPVSIPLSDSAGQSYLDHTIAVIPRHRAPGIPVVIAGSIVIVTVLVTMMMAITPGPRNAGGALAQKIPASDFADLQPMNPLAGPQSPLQRERAGPRRGQSLSPKGSSTTAEQHSEPAKTIEDSSRAIHLADLRTIASGTEIEPLARDAPAAAPVSPTSGRPASRAEPGPVSEPSAVARATITAKVQNKRRSAISRGYRYEFDIVLHEMRGIAVESRETTLRWVADSGTSGKSKVSTPERFAPSSSETYHISVDLLGTDDGYWRGTVYYEGAGIDESGQPVRISLSLRLDASFMTSNSVARSE